MKKYFNNKYILFGLIGIAIYLYKINQKPKSKISPPKDTLIFPPKDILMVQRESKQEENDLEDENDEEVMVGQNFIDDVKKMDNYLLKRTMETNKKILKRAKMTDKKKEMVKEMLSYMKREYDSRTEK